MKSKSIVLAITLAAASVGSAFAGGRHPADSVTTERGVTSQSRAQVKAETAAAARLGLLSVGEAGPRQATPAEQSIIANAGRQAALADGGQYIGNTSDFSVAVYKSRAEVRAETDAARRLGLLNYGEAGPRQGTPEEERIIAEAGNEIRMAQQRDQSRNAMLTPR